MILHFLARHGPWVLISGLLAGLLLPGLAAHLQPLIPPMVMALLCLAALRMEPRALLGSVRALPRVALAVLVLQLLFPLLVLAMGAALGQLGSPVLLALVLVAAAPSITGSPNMLVMFGLSPEVALRTLVAGTALMPLTVIPIFWVLPGVGGVAAVSLAALKLFGIVLAGVGLAVFIRWRWLRRPDAGQLKQLEGASALMLAIFVVALMPALAEALWFEPARAGFWLGFVFVVNLGLQGFSFLLLRKRMQPSGAVALSVIAGNRNVALFLAALPVEVMAPLMIFVGCYQLPMYLTPLIMRRFYLSAR